MIVAIVILLVLILLACMGLGELLGELIVMVAISLAGLAFLAAIAGGIVWSFVVYPGPATLAAFGIGSAMAIGLALHGTIWGCCWLIRTLRKQLARLATGRKGEV
jgi:hypothetical protein